MKRWITFDLDGTLMQNPFSGSIFPELEELVSADLNEPCGLKRKLLEEHERLLASGQIVSAYDWDEIVGRLLRELGVRRKVDILEMVRRHSVPPNIFLLDETILPSLKRLKRSGFSLAAVTNGFYKYQYPVMKALGLTDQLDEIVTPDRVGCAKPDARMADGLRLEGAVAVHVGDRLDHDMVFAHAIGVPAVLIHRRLPDALLPLSPGERAESENLLPVLRRLASQENLLPEDAASLPDRFMPSYVIRDLRELFACLEAEKNRERGGERGGSGT
ncbi:HAD family hydrolase [Cohnella algarum]|uniref:HAD family hydrolase n=1 Tax=Cohnella algarum TaxID=2044859 RepID=UPI001967781B|nr:HAD family hydrolase [Cohnella algarum]MBN2982921.1 HAD family hydrolase [Cohnella algarum]